jgi:hypothetical protein
MFQLKTPGDGHVEDRCYATSRKFCLATGLLEDNAKFIHCLEQQELYATDSAQREIFVCILLFCDCNDASGLWERCKEIPCEAVVPFFFIPNELNRILQ